MPVYNWTEAFSMFLLLVIILSYYINTYVDTLFSSVSRLTNTIVGFDLIQFQSSSLFKSNSTDLLKLVWS